MSWRTEREIEVSVCLTGILKGANFVGVEGNSVSSGELVIGSARESEVRAGKDEENQEGEGEAKGEGSHGGGKAERGEKQARA